MMLNKIDKLIVAQVFSLLICIFLSILKVKHFLLIMIICASFVFLKIVKDITKNYFSLPFIFAFFHVLYGLSGVVAVTWGDGLSSTYGQEFNIYPYLILYTLCTLALTIGMYLCNLKCNKEDSENLKFDKNISDYFFIVACLGLLSTTLFEFINFFRVGGWETLLKGKAIYQAAVDELFLTLPTQLIFQVSLASLGVYIILHYFEKKQILVKKIIMCLCFAIPYLSMLLFLGRRGPLLACLLIMILAISQIKPVKKITAKMFVVLLGAYLCLASLYGIRNYVSLAFTDFDMFVFKVFDKRNVVNSLNPGINEFGCTFGNFNKLYISDDYEFLYGKSYIQGITHFIPSYFYPGDKPQMITYQFRDKYFQSKAEISSIASTAFSSIMEAYWNFGYLGFIIYLFLGVLIILFDKVWKYKNCFILLLYIAVCPLMYSFHRSDFAHVSSEFILIVLMIFVIYMFYKNIYKRFCLLKNK